MIADLVALARLHHWIKSGFILLPLPFAVAAGAELDRAVVLVGVVGFCVLSSAAYAFNDIRDAEADRRNPAKRGRPVASGAIGEGAAYASAGLLLGLAGALVFATGRPAAWLLAAIYVAANLSYSLGLKHVPLLDVFILASGYMIRVLFGCALVQAEASGWLLICSSAVALFLAFAKRRGDLLAGVSQEHRPALAGYSVQFLDQAMGICAGMALLAYALYSQEAAVFLDGREFAGLPFVSFGVLNYLRLAYTEGAGSSPVELALRSVSLKLCGLGWLAATAWSLGVF